MLLRGARRRCGGAGRVPWRFAASLAAGADTSTDRAARPRRPQPDASHSVHRRDVPGRVGPAAAVSSVRRRSGRRRTERCTDDPPALARVGRPTGRGRSPSRGRSSSGVVGGRGGAGASTLAAARRATARAADGDRAGRPRPRRRAGSTCCSGSRRADGVRWPDLADARGDVRRRGRRSRCCRGGVRARCSAPTARGPARPSRRSSPTCCTRSTREVGRARARPRPSGRRGGGVAGRGVRRGPRRGAAGPAHRRRGPRDAAVGSTGRAGVAGRARARARRARRRGAVARRSTCRSLGTLPHGPWAGRGARARRGAASRAGPLAPRPGCVAALERAARERRRPRRTRLPRRASGRGVGPVVRRGARRRRRGRRARRRARCSGPAPLGSVTRAVRDELFGAGPLQALLDDPDVTDVLVNGPRDVWVERAGRLAPRGRRPRGCRRRPGARGPARGGGRPTARRRRRRRSTRGCPTAPACTPCCRRSPARGALISLRVVRSRAFTVDAARARPARSRRALVPVVRALVADAGEPPGLRRHRLRQDDAARGAAVAGAARRAASSSSRRPASSRPAHPHVVRLLARQRQRRRCRRAST